MSLLHITSMCVFYIGIARNLGVHAKQKNIFNGVKSCDCGFMFMSKFGIIFYYFKKYEKFSQ